jgi:hypothetical protein
MKNKVAIILYVLVFSLVPEISAQALTKGHLKQLADEITSEEVYQYVLEMVDPKYKGRLAGTPEYMEIARWVADLFYEWGIDAAGDDGSFFQFFDQPYSEVPSPGRLAVIFDGKAKDYFAPFDYVPGSNSARGSIEADLVFVGYGITAPELGYDDYASIDVKGKIVVIAPGNPYKGQQRHLQTQWGEYSSSRRKLDNAIRQGAAGAIYMDNLASPGGPYSEGFIYVHVAANVIEDIFAHQAADVKQLLESIDETMTPASFLMNSSAVLSAETTYHPHGITANVVGVIPGSDLQLKNEFIIMGAHLDGQGFLGTFFPGALDNASGVANVMAAARGLSQLRGQLKRTVVFILFGAEETGLVGSEHYCLNPLAGPEKTILFMNLDMVGNGSGLAVWGAESFPGLYEHFVNANQLIGRSLRTSAFRYPTGRPRTDGAMFSLHGFRTVHIGTTDRVNPLFYHDVRDTADLLVPEIMRDAARLLLLSAAQMANDHSFTADDLPKVSDFAN